MKERIIFLSLTCLLMLGLSACGGGKTELETTAVATAVVETGAEIRSATETENQQEETENGLVAVLESVRGEALPFDQSIFKTDERIYTFAELRAMSDEELAILRNELYARHGRIFKGEEWTEFFTQFIWYEQLYTAEQFYEQELFSDLEKENLRQVLAVESERNASALFTLDTYPKVDGSTATIPLSEQIAADSMGLAVEEARLYILHNKTHNAYVNLIEGKADIIFVTAPSEEELQMARDAGVELEIYPVVREGFVFLVNEQNTVESLTQQQIRDIYSGNIVNWREVGGKDEEIIPYQRPVNSGSQSGLLSLVMKDTPIMKAPSYQYLLEMEGLVEAVSSYDNAENAIGYSYYYYVSSMYFRKRIRLLAVDGIVPDKTTIQDGSYPYTTAYYAVLKKSEPQDSNARKLLDWISTKGTSSVEKAGYVPVK